MRFVSRNDIVDLRFEIRNTPGEVDMGQRIAAVQEPYDAEVGEQLRSMMPAGMAPIALFRTFIRNSAMTEAMHGWGRYELSSGLSLTMREREIVIDRTCALCRCEYEWGVHILFYAERVGFTAAQVASLTHGRPDDACWEGRERLLVRAIDELHHSNDIADSLWAELAAEFSDAQLLDLTMLCGWYHAISFTARAARVDLEAGAPRFDDHLPLG
ncbi:MAG: carboxymuconolactone decarboxylase family protein [Acidimicrobiales bacterium]